MNHDASPIELAVVDVDGTLLTPDKELTKRAQGAVRALREAGVRVALTSGRPPRGMRMLIDPLAIHTPLATFNGGMFVDHQLSVLEQHVIPASSARDAVSLLEECGLDVWVYRGKEWYVRDADAPHVDKEQRTVEFEPTVVETLDDLLDRAVKIVGVSDDPDRMARTEKEAAGLGSEVSASRSQPYYLDITHPKANKGSVVERLSTLLSVPLDRIATFGDMPNDVDMFEASGLSIAMGNANDDVKAQADEVAPPNTEEGFARAVEALVLPRAPGRQA